MPLNCPHCGQDISSLLGKAKAIMAYYDKLTTAQAADFRTFHSISWPIAYTIAREFVDPKHIRPTGEEWVDNLYREVEGYIALPASKRPRFDRESE
jgi:hypothetical protein